MGTVQYFTVFTQVESTAAEVVDHSDSYRHPKGSCQFARNFGALGSAATFVAIALSNFDTQPYLAETSLAAH